jgi:hypothetical protein
MSAPTFADHPPVRLSTRARFPVNPSLVERQIAAARLKGENSIKAVLLPDHKPDLDFEDLPV